jgi:hypothetical protein
MKSDATLPVIFILGAIVLALIYGQAVLKIVILSPFIFILLGFIIAPIIKVLKYFKSIKREEKTMPLKNRGFEIIQSATRWCGRAKVVIAVKKMTSGQNKYVTWVYINEDFLDGNIFSSFNAASEDFNKRVEGIDLELKAKES